MRTAFVSRLIDLASEDSRITLLVGDLGFSVVEEFAEKFPDRFFNLGVAEQNLIGVASGLASEGFRPFAYSIANFSTFRAAEQIRNDADYHNLPVTIVAVGGGVAYGSLGYSHHAIQDYGLMRLFPNMMIAAPGDAFETRTALTQILAQDGPAYLRLGRDPIEPFNAHQLSFEPGFWNPIKVVPNSEVAIISTGAAAKFAAKLAAQLSHQKPSTFTLPLWGMKFGESQVAQLSKFREVHTIEDHLLDSGFGSWLLEVANDFDLDVRIVRHGFTSAILGQVGDQEYLERVGGIVFD